MTARVTIESHNENIQVTAEDAFPNGSVYHTELGEVQAFATRFFSLANSRKLILSVPK